MPGPEPSWCSKTLTLFSPVLQARWEKSLSVAQTLSFHCQASEETQLDPKTSLVLSVTEPRCSPLTLSSPGNQCGSQSMSCAVCSDLHRGTWWCRSTPCTSQDTRTCSGAIDFLLSTGWWGVSCSRVSQASLLSVHVKAPCP